MGTTSHAIRVENVFKYNVLNTVNFTMEKMMAHQYVIFHSVFGRSLTQLKRSDFQSYMDARGDNKAITNIKELGALYSIEGIIFLS